MNPTSPKAWGGAIGASAGTVLAGFLLWLIGAWLFRAGFGADQVDNAIAAVPWPLTAFVWWVVSAALAFVGAYVRVDPERLATLGEEQRRRVGLQGVDVRPRHAAVEDAPTIPRNDSGRDVIR